MIDPSDQALSIVRQCALLSVSRSGVHDQPVGETAENLALMRLIDQQFILSRTSRNQKGNAPPSAVRAILDDPPIYIRPVCSRISGCRG